MGCNMLDEICTCSFSDKQVKGTTAVATFSAVAAIPVDPAVN